MERGRSNCTSGCESKHLRPAVPSQRSDASAIVLNDDSFIASRFVNPRMFDGLSMRGELVAIIPDRDTFFVADSEDLETVAGLSRLAQRQLEAGERIISGLPFVLRSGCWHVYEPPQPIRALFANVALQYRAKNWNDFKAVLAKELKRRGEDVFIASLEVCEEGGVDSRFSLAVWSRGVDTVLPVVDRVSPMMAAQGTRALLTGITLCE